MIAAVFPQILNVDNLIAEPAGVGDSFDWLHIAEDFESTAILNPHSMISNYCGQCAIGSLRRS
jgi:hypothetical protein